jgi:hypothetical protein
MSKPTISKLIVQLYEKNYADANSTLQKILQEKIAVKVQKMAKAKKAKLDKSIADKKKSKMGTKKNK